MTRPAWWLICAAALAAGCERQTPTPQVVINGHRWFVDLAATPAERYQGLSGRASVPDDVGMLFVFPDAAVRSFCMRGCLVDLDVAFIGDDWRIKTVHTRTVEPDLGEQKGYSSDVPVRYALEVAGGGLARAGVGVGDHVEFAGCLPPAR